jgi:hypothetical protein
MFSSSVSSASAAAISLSETGVGKPGLLFAGSTPAGAGGVEAPPGVLNKARLQARLASAMMLAEAVIAIRD